ncbi:hypothetical protein SISSUDRAFT_1067276 [Sistotremastrum suecicum HHB10207 ss-3]|uniref:Uncharacterized protein n=1 Tax=Sistotremastrum suecicum HHB10207 ss-3 TaxID=1314776 RepID=A0A165XAK6_9AGAM|nr:hypothetical protein SISSUDRAFT_1067276 [Sistotremastrum suecicum HHB10207 ss-3]
MIGDIDLGLAKGLTSGYGRLEKLVSRGWKKIGGVALMERLEGCWDRTRKSSGIKREESRSTDTSSDTFSWRQRATGALRKTFNWMKTCRIKVNRSEDELMNAYFELLTDTSDPILLERAVASFRYRDWVQYGDGSMDQLRKVLSRLMATDVSFRVRETVSAQISRFSAWIPERREQMKEVQEAIEEYRDEEEMEEKEKREEEEKRRAIQLTKFLVGRQEDDISDISEHFTPTWENCTDLLDLISLPIDKFVAKCISIHDHNINLGNHREIFDSSVNHCDDLLDADKFDDVTRIFSHVDLFSAVRSFALVDYRPFYDNVLEFIIGDRRAEILHFLLQIVSTPRDWSDLITGASSTFLIATGSPPHFPSDLDLSPIIAHIGQHPSWWNWPEVCDTLIAYLAQRNILTLSDPVGVHHFLHQCVHLELAHPWAAVEVRRTSPDTRNAALILLHRHEAFFAPFAVPLPPSPLLSASDDAISPSGQDSDLDFPLLSNSDDPEEVPSLPIHTLDDLIDPVIANVQLSHPKLPSTSAASSSADHHVVDMTDTEI